MLLTQFTVDSLADNTDGSDGLTTLREAVLAATSDGDEIVFQDGLNGTVSLTLGELPLTADVIVRGNGMDSTTIDAGGLSRIFNGGRQTVELIVEDLTLTGGNASGAGENGGAAVVSRFTTRNSRISGNTATASGGAVYSYNGWIRVENSLVTGNTAGSAGAFRGNYFTSISITDSIVTGNTATGLGGVALTTDRGGIGVVGSEIRGNTAGAGGALAAIHEVASISVRDSVIADNTSDGPGGAIYLSGNDQSLLVRRSTVSGNRTLRDGADGGGIYVYGGYGPIRIEESTISGNRTEGTGANGGAIAVANPVDEAPALTIRNSTISGNRVEGSGSDGGGVHTSGGRFSPAFNATIRNSTITGNSVQGGGSGGGVFLEGPTDIESSIVAANTSTGTNPDLLVPADAEIRATLVGDNSGTHLARSSEPDANGNIIGSGASPIDPSIGPLADNGGPTHTHALQSDSPAIDRGSNPDDLVNDQRGDGFLREVNGIADMGAVEGTDRAGLRITDAQTAETDSGTVELTLSVTLSGTADGPFTVNFATQDATATLADGDYVQRSGTLSFDGTAGETRQITITINGDARLEEDETFQVVISDVAPSGSVTISDNTAIATIQNDETYDGLTLEDRLLRVTGTPENDVIILAESGTDLTIDRNGVIHSLRTNQYDAIQIHGLDGSDVIDTQGVTIGVRVNAGSGNDVIRAGPGDDTLQGGGGDDTQTGGGGADVLRGGGGHDSMSGGDGPDTVTAGSGQDSLSGDADSDFLMGGGGADVVRGGRDDDRLHGGGGADMLIGGDGNDELNGGSGQDALRGQAGDDVLFGNNGSDDLRGGSGNDIILGGNGNDVIRGGSGLDVLYGASGADALFGDNGDDILIAGTISSASVRLNLDDILAEWASGKSYHQRSENIRHGPGENGALNAPTYLIGKSQPASTVFDDGVHVDQLTGGDGVDLFFALGSVDELLDRTSDEHLEEI